MPNFKTHALIGAAVGVGAYVAYSTFFKDRERDEPFDWCTAAFCGGLGALAASVPDLLEPATSPNHRGFFHSIFVLALVGVCLARITAKCSFKLLLYVAGAAYISHLLADARTKRCIPWI